MAFCTPIQANEDPVPATHMTPFDLTIPLAKVPLAKKEAAAAGGRLLTDETRTDGYVFLAPSLPAALKPFMTPASPGDAASEPGSSAPRPDLYWALNVPFTHRALSAKAGARWDKQTKCFFYVGPSLPKELSAYAALPYSLESTVQRVQRHLPAASWPPSGDAMIPRPHQVTACEAAVAAAQAGYPGFLLADEVGLGKTISAWSGAQQIAAMLRSTSALIVAPLSVLAHWRETLSRMGSTIPDVTLLNYDRLDKLFEMPEGVTAKSKKGIARRAAAPEVDIVIFDESHKLKNPLAARSKLATKIAANAKFCFYLSATAGQNPLELAYLAALIAKSTGVSAKSLKDFEQWCFDQNLGLSRGDFGAIKWSGDIEDCERLRKILYEGKPGKPPAGLRRRPEHIQGWPEISRILLPQELSVEQRLLYQASWESFRSAMAAGKIAPTRGKPSSNKGMGALIEALRFRQKSSELRIDQTAAFAMDLLEEGIKPAISCAFKISGAAIKAKLESKGLIVSYIHGALDPAAREAERLNFQQGRADVIIFTIEEGISLHQGQYAVDTQPRALVIHDLRWSAIQMAQIEGRTHRDGKFAQAYWMAGENTVEMGIAKRVSEKTVAMKSLSGDADVTIDEVIMAVLLAST